MRALEAPLKSAPVSGRIRRAAIVLFRRRGYHATTLRALARMVRIQAGSIYYYFPSKQSLLFEILDRTMDELLEGVQRATAGISDPVERLKAAVRFHVLFHARHRDEAFISRMELRSLTREHLRRTLAKRDTYEGKFRAFLEAGVAGGLFEVPDVAVAAMAILTMSSGVADWFSERGWLSAEAVADHYAEMILGAVAARPQ